METVFFLVFVGVCAFLVVWLTRRSSPETDLTAHHRASTKTEPLSEALSTPAANRLSSKEELWEARRKRAGEALNSSERFVPKFEAAKAAQYDGYSRRDRHHLTAGEHVKEEAHIEEPQQT